MTNCVNNAESKDDFNLEINNLIIKKINKNRIYVFKKGAYMKEITNIKEIQKIELDILDFVVSICKRNNLRYFMVGGTLLGAVRHKGFIPWDDDVDIAMPRNDYERFISIMLNTKDNNIYKICCMQENNYYSYPFCKITDARTKIIYENINELVYDEGLSIDVFPMDGMGNDYELAKKELIKIFRKYTNILSTRLPFKYVKREQYIKFFLKKIYYFPYSIIGRKNSLNRIITKLDDFDTSKYVASIFGLRKDKEIIERSCFDIIQIEFEGKKYNAPSGFDKYLHNMYGEYMKVPSKDEQIMCHNMKAFWKEV